jgi:hypothetical protein
MVQLQQLDVFVFSGHSLSEVATTAQQTSRELLAVGPDMAIVLAVVVLRKASLNSV